MSELKVYGFCNIDDFLYRGTDRGQSSDEMLPYYLKSEADKVIAHHKYKRCLAMAKQCDALALFYGNAVSKVLNRDITDPSRQKVFRRLYHYQKWLKRWLKIAEKFKQ